MIVIAVVENTGVFQWLAYFAYRISRGNTIQLLIILMLITGIASAFLDNVTTMLLMTPITVQIALAIGINPLALLIPEVMASNVIGVSTLVGTPTNILIGSFAGLSFTDFLRNLTPGVLLAFVGLVVYSAYVYRRELAVAHEASPTLTEKLAESGRITEPENLRKAALIGAGSNALYYCLSVGAAFGGNGSLIGASANMITGGISGAAGFPITYGYFLRKGIPAVIITVALASIWLLIRFL